MTDRTIGTASASRRQPEESIFRTGSGFGVGPEEDRWVWITSEYGSVRRVPESMASQYVNEGWVITGTSPQAVARRANSISERFFRSNPTFTDSAEQWRVAGNPQRVTEVGQRNIYELKLTNENNVTKSFRVYRDGTMVDASADALPEDPSDLVGAGVSKEDEEFFYQQFPDYEIRGEITEERVASFVSTAAARARAARELATMIAASGRASKEGASKAVQGVLDRGGLLDDPAQSELANGVAALYDQGRDELADRLLDGEITTRANTEFEVPVVQAEEPNLDDYLAGLLGSMGGGGGGGGVRRTYTPPDRREVEDLVRGMTAGLVGNTVEQQVQDWTDFYMREDRRAFDKPTVGISPKAAVLEKIRNTGDYKRIHKLRPDSVDERQWVTQQQQAAMSAGLTAQRATDFAVTQATVGGSVTNVGDAVATQEFQRTGQNTPEFFNRFRAQARNIFGGVQ